jgi:hypothetical protein
MATGYTLLGTARNLPLAIPDNNPAQFGLRASSGALERLLFPKEPCADRGIHQGQRDAGEHSYSEIISFRTSLPRRKCMSNCIFHYVFP